VKAYYNEIDHYCCDWLSNLMDAGHITPGKIDDRSIADVSPDDVRGFERVHFFAGIAGWDLALNLAGWADGPVWSGSCPCQPFSAAGQGKAADDERHLWPDWFRLIRAVRPPTVFLEQVEAAIGWGWLDLVHADLGAEGYTTRFAVLPACGVGAPHIRQRLWFVAQSGGTECGQGRPGRDGANSGGSYAEPAGSGHAGLVADRDFSGLEIERKQPAWNQRASAERGGAAGPWSDLVWLPCTDGKARPTQPGIFPLAARISGRVGRLRAYGNSIVPQVAAEFIMVTMPA
jgi:DNA (cytosine-5)-methyltransferase 1